MGDGVTHLATAAHLLDVPPGRLAHRGRDSQASARARHAYWWAVRAAGDLSYAETAAAVGQVLEAVRYGVGACSGRMAEDDGYRERVHRLAGLLWSEPS